MADIKYTPNFLVERIRESFDSKEDSQVRKVSQSFPFILEDGRLVESMPSAAHSRQLAGRNTIKKATKKK